MSRLDEQLKYRDCYELPNYKMGQNRMHDALDDLRKVTPGSYLDVGCGRGEMINHAESLGFSPVQGVEVVPALIDGTRVIYGEGHALPFPDKSFDVVAMWDVIEHLLPGDDELVCLELGRVARRNVLLTASNRPSVCPTTNANLHINIRPYTEWDALFKEWFDGEVVWLKDKRCSPSGQWRITF